MFIKSTDKLIELVLLHIDVSSRVSCGVCNNGCIRACSIKTVFLIIVNFIFIEQGVSENWFVYFLFRLVFFLYYYYGD